MIDRTIPFFNMILRCDAPPHQPPVLPEGYAIRPYRPGDEAAWARLECALGDFATPAEATAYFTATYLRTPEEAARRALFLIAPDGHAAGACIAWRDRRGGSEVASLHWLVVEEAHQGRGLGRALTLAALAVFHRLGEAPVYIHTQPWSWKALLLYDSLGFRLMRTDSFAQYVNQYDQAMEALRGVLPPEKWQALAARSA